MSETAGKYRRLAPPQGTSLLPTGLRLFFWHRFLEMLGLLCLGAAAAIFLALLSYNRNDPSLNHASDNLPTNLLGRGGAIFSDLALQNMGIASLTAVYMLAAWGWILLRHRLISRFWLRLALFPLAITMTALALASLPPAMEWPGQFGCAMGGCLGLLVQKQIILNPFGENNLTMTLSGVISGIIALYLIYYVSAIPWLRYQNFWRSLVSNTAIALEFIWRHILRLASWSRQKAAFGLHALRCYFAEKKGEPAPPPYQLDRRKFAAPAEETEASAALPIPAMISANHPLQERSLLGDDPEILPPHREEPDSLASLPHKLRRGLVERSDKSSRDGKDKKSQQPRLHLDKKQKFALPSLELLQAPVRIAASIEIDEEGLEKNARLLESVLEDFGVRGQVQKVRPGPVVTLYEFEPAPGTKTSRVVGLADDVARSMSALSVRIAVVPGRSVIGIELPNQKRETVAFRELLGADIFRDPSHKLSLALGKDIGGAPVVADLAKMPHLLIAGTTGSGKSVAINTMILSLLYRLSPEQCKFIMIDPKMLELSVYDNIPHLLSPVVTDPKKAIVALKWTVREMESRYRAMSKLGVRNIEGYNQRVIEAKANGETLTRKVQTGFNPETGAPLYEEDAFDLTPLPFIVVVVDEMADLMLVAGKEIEAAIQRLAQMARAAGIHIIMATQRPSVDVITGTIKANFPTRISFHVTSRIDSRTILGEMGAEQLLGQGDMLYMGQGGRITRVHGPFVSDAEVEKVVTFLKQQGAPSYIEEITREEEEQPEFGGEDGESGDALYDQAVALVLREGKASTSFVQRHLQIGYNRAARLVERMEKEGLVSAANHVGKREVLGRSGD